MGDSVPRCVRLVMGNPPLDYPDSITLVGLYARAIVVPFVEAVHLPSPFFRGPELLGILGYQSDGFLGKSSQRVKARPVYDPRQVLVQHLIDHCS